MIEMKGFSPSIYWYENFGEVEFQTKSEMWTV